MDIFEKECKELTSALLFFFTYEKLLSECQSSCYSLNTNDLCNYEVIIAEQICCDSYP